MSKLKKKTYKNPLNTISILLFIFYTVIYFTFRFYELLERISKGNDLCREKLGSPCKQDKIIANVT